MRRWLNYSTSCTLIPLGTACELKFQAHSHAHYSFKHIQDKQCSRTYVWACSFFFFLLKAVERSWHTLPQWAERRLVAGWESKIILPVPSVKQVGYEGSRSKCPSPSFLCTSFAPQQSPVLHERRELYSISRESSFRLEPMWSHFEFPMRRQKDAPFFSWGLATCSSAKAQTPPPSLSLSSPLSRSPSWSCSVCALTRSGMHSYPLWLRHTHTRKYMSVSVCLVAHVFLCYIWHIVKQNHNTRAKNCEIFRLWNIFVSHFHCNYSSLALWMTKKINKYSTHSTRSNVCGGIQTEWRMPLLWCKNGCNE